MRIRPGILPFTVVAAALAVTTGAFAGDRDSDRDGIAAQMEIAQLTTTYAWAVDAKDIEKMMSIFSEDAVYDLSAYNLPPAVGKAAIRNVFLYGVFPVEKCSFSSISNVAVDIAGRAASGSDYFMHFGYNSKYAAPNTRTYSEGQHYYKFVKERGHWKISWMQGSPVFESSQSITPTQLRNPACR